MAEYIDPETGLKVRKLTELRQTAGQEYQDVMLSRVEEYTQKGDSSFNNTIENVIVKGLNALLNLKVKIDESMGEETKNKVQDIVEKLLLFGL